MWCPNRNSELKVMANQELQDRTALVTGAGRGIGQAIALGFAKSGASVACAARTTEQVQTTAGLIMGLGGQALALTCDVTNIPQVEVMCAQTVSGLGGLDIVVINAGIELEKSSIAESDPALWAQVIQTNLIGAYNCARAAIPHLQQRGGGKIIVVGSGMGHRGAARSSAYCCSKAGLWMLTRVLAQEVWDDGIAVNELVPGPVETDMTRWARQQEATPPNWTSEWFKQPEDVVPLALFLATQPHVGPTAQSFSLMRRDS